VSNWHRVIPVLLVLPIIPVFRFQAACRPSFVALRLPSCLVLLVVPPNDPDALGVSRRNSRSVVLLACLVFSPLVTFRKRIFYGRFSPILKKYPTDVCRLLACLLPTDASVLLPIPSALLRTGQPTPSTAIEPRSLSATKQLGFLSLPF